jgi:hypothetical protein
MMKQSKSLLEKSVTILCMYLLSFSLHTLPLNMAYLYMRQALLCPLRLVHMSAALTEEFTAALTSSTVTPTLAITCSVQGLNTSNYEDEVS